MSPFRLALAVVQNRLGLVPRPGFCTYLVTYRCNARCQMCDSWRLKPGSELSVSAVRDVFQKIGKLDVVRLSGGEPFLRADLLEIAEAVSESSRPHVLHITSNGSFPERIEHLATHFSKPRKLRFLISLDGLEREHDQNRGEQVSFAKALESVGRLRTLRSSGVRFSVNHTVISKESLEAGPELARRLGKLDTDVGSVLAYADSAMYGIKLRGKKAEHLVDGSYPLHPKLAGADTVGFVERELARTDTIKDPLLRLGKRYYLKGLLARLEERSATKPRRPRCVALRSHLRLLPDGSVPVCQFNTEKVGNLHSDSFETVWTARATQEARKWVDACPGCWAECEVMPSAIYTGDIVRELVARPRHLPRDEHDPA